jgi:hypothetical protein
MGEALRLLSELIQQNQKGQYQERGHMQAYHRSSCSTLQAYQVHQRGQLCRVHIWDPLASPPKRSAVTQLLEVHARGWAFSRLKNIAVSCSHPSFPLVKINEIVGLDTLQEYSLHPQPVPSQPPSAEKLTI